jgi:uncharacterized protein YaiI (UPF0178 family)
MSLIQIPGTNLYRDTETMALINRDKNGLDEYLTKRRIMENQRREINNMKTDITVLKDDMQEIKKMLCTLLEKGSNGQ